jgi:hypothetical protein
MELQRVYCVGGPADRKFLDVEYHRFEVPEQTPLLAADDPVSWPRTTEYVVHKVVARESPDMPSLIRAMCKYTALIAIPTTHEPPTGMAVMQLWYRAVRGGACK